MASTTAWPLTRSRSCTTIPDTPLLAGEVGASRSALAERFPKAVGQTPMQYLARRRLALAASLLNDGATVAAVARRVGYGSEAAFSRAFKRSTGITPSAWRGEDRTA